MQKPEGYIFGRPTEYKKEYCEKANEYISSCVDEISEFHKTRGDKSDSYDRVLDVNIPTIEGFSQFLGFTVKTLYNWSEENADFLQALELITTEQKRRLVKEGLAGNYNPLIAKLVLSANHGMREGKDVTSGGDKVKSISVEIIENGSET